MNDVIRRGRQSQVERHFPDEEGTERRYESAQQGRFYLHVEDTSPMKRGLKGCICRALHWHRLCVEDTSPMKRGLKDVRTVIAACRQLAVKDHFPDEEGTESL